MADQNIVTNITATANFSSLTTQLQAVTSQLLKLQATTIGLNKNLTSQVGVMNRQFDETMRSTGQFSRHFVTLTSDVSKFGQNLDSGRMKLSQYFNTYQGHTKKTSSLVKELAKQQVMMENAVVQPIGKNAQGLMQYNVMVQSGLDATKNKAALLRQELTIMNKVMNDGAGQLINWGKNTQWAGRQLTVGLTVPLAAFGMAAAKAFRQADEELVRLTKVYGGLTATSTSDLLQVRKDVAALSRELAGSLGANFTETIALAADIAATGKEGEALLESTRQTTRLAILGEVDRQEAMKATLSIQTAFGQNTQELAESIDFLNAVENQTSTSLDDLVTAIPKAGPVVKALGGDIQDLALYLTAMREGGINASESANALKSALASVINPTKVAKEMFFGLGIDLSGIVDKNAGNLTGTIMALKDSLDSLEPLQRARAIEQLFGKFQFARINALFTNLGKEGSQTLQVLDLMKASTKDLASISERELTALTESASGRYRRALEAVKADLAVVGEQFLKVGTFILNAIDGIIKFIGNLPGPIKAVLGFLGSLTAIAGPIIMLTGVLANFFGYIIKGVLALKNIGKGGTGFKLLTPELMAASSAAKTVEQAFYSDTKAAATFSDAVLTLASSFEKLKQSAMSSTIATSNSMSTAGGNTVLAGGGRIVDKNNPLVGKPYSRDMSHMIPTASKTAQQRAEETIFSTMPGPKPVNQKISNAPQLYMNEDLPRIPGLSSANGVSTGVVAGEAAKWHSMTSALAMQSKAELAQLKTEVAATGTITSSLSDSYQALLPQMTKITSLAADETALIVKQLQAGKITVEAARTKIMALNAQVEAMMVQTAQGIATAQARTLNTSMVPLTNQPVVSAAGKSNMKELFHKGNTASLVDSVARSLGVRTSGAGYSIQTTIPRRYNAGGQVESFGKNKTTVSGPASISYDDRLGSIPVGGYVLNQSASMDPRNAPLVKAAASTHSGSGSGNITALLTPKETIFGAGIKENPELFRAVDAANNGVPLSSHAGGGKIKLSRSSYGPVASANIIRSLFTSNRSSYRKQLSSLADRRNLDRITARERDSQFIGSYGTRKWLSRGASTRSVIDDYIKSLPAQERRRAASVIEDFAANVKTGRGGLEKGFGRDPFTIESGHLEKGGALDKILLGNKLPLLNLDKITHATHLTRAAVKNGKRFVSRYTVNYDSRSNLQANHGTLTAKNFLDRNMNRTGKYDLLLQRAGVNRSKWKSVEKEIDQKITGALKGKESKRIGDSKGDITLDSFIPLIDSSIIAAGGSAGKLNALKNNTILRKNAGGMISDSSMTQVIGNRGGKAIPLPSQNGSYNMGGQIGGIIKLSKRNYGVPIGQGGFPMFRGNYKSPLMLHPEQIKLQQKQNAERFERTPKDDKGQIWDTPLDLALMREGKGRARGAFPLPKYHYQDLANDDPTHGALQIGRFKPPMQVRNRYVGEQVRYRSDKNWRGLEGTTAPAFEIGNLETRAKSALFRYMQGDYSAIDNPAVQAYLTTLRKKFTGVLHRGVSNVSALPPVISNLIRDGRYSELVGKEFIMRRSSWSTNKDTAAGFGKLQLVADVKNRNAVPASSIFPDLTFQTPKGPVAVNENEVYMGGKFKIVSAQKDRLQLQAVFDSNRDGTPLPKRENGGPVNAGSSYLVGEKGPELFVPKNSGGIIPSYEIGGLIRRGKNSYGISGNPAKRAEQEAAQKARAAAFTPAPINNPEHKDGPLSVGRTTVVGSGGVRTNAYGLQGALPYTPGLTIGNQTLNRTQAALMSASKQIEMSLFALGSSVKKDAIAAGRVLKYSGDQLVIGARLLPSQIKSSFDPLVTGIKSVGTRIVEVTKQTAAQLNSLRQSLFSPQIIAPRAPGALINPDRTFMQNSRQSFAANARYSTTAMLNPIQYGRSVLNRPIDPDKPRGGGMGGMAAGMGGMMAGGAIGEKLGGQTGMLIGSMGGMMAANAAATKGAAAFAGLSASMGGAGFAATAVAAAGVVAPILAVTAAVAAGVIAFKHYKRGQELNQVTFGLTAEAAKKAGVRFTDFGSRIKDTIQDAKDMADANKLVYESMKDGGTPFQMTIAEYRKLKVEVKETFSEQIKALDRQPSNKVPDAVRRIKEQLVAAGMSAEEATKKVYTMLQLSNKKDQSITATMGNAQFRAVTDPQSAAVSAVTSFGADTRDQGNKEKAASLNTALMATETGINDLIAKRERLVAKDLSGKTKALTYAEAEKIMIDRINKSKESGTKITQGTVDEMAKTNPEIKKMINGTDTVVSVFQKIRLQAQGFKGDLSELNAAQTKALAEAFAAISDSVTATNRTGILKDQYANLDKLKAQISGYAKALKGQTVAEQISDRDRLKALNKQIDAVNKLADARKKALQAAQADSDLGRKIEKTRLEMQNAAAVGDTATEQSLRIDLESLTSQQQTEAQMRAIDKAAEAGTKPLRAAIDAISNNQEKLSDSAALAGEGLDKLQARYEKQDAAIKRVNDSMIALYGNAAAAGKSVEDYVKANKEAAAALVADYEAATGKKMPRYTTATTTEVTSTGPVKTTTRVPVSPQQNALDVLAKSGTGAGINEALASSIKGGATLKDIVNAVKNRDGSEIRKDIQVTGDYSKNMEMKTYDGKQTRVLDRDAKTQIGRRLGLAYDETFVFDGKRYRKSGKNDNAIVYVGPADVVKRANGGIIRGPGTGTSDSIPALLSDGEFVVNAKSSQAFGYGNLDKINRMAAGGRASRFNFDRQSFDVRNGVASNNSFVLNQNIYASEGMDVEALSNMIVKKAEVVIGQKAKINVKMVGQGKNI